MTMYLAKKLLVFIAATFSIPSDFHHLNQHTTLAQKLRVLLSFGKRISGQSCALGWCILNLREK